MRKRTISIQLFAILLVVLSVPTVLVSYYSAKNMMNYSQEKIAETALDSLESVVKVNEIMLFNIVKNVLRLTENTSFRNLKKLNSFEVLNATYENVQIGNAASKVMSEFLYNDEAIHSIYFLKDGADYVVSTDKGIIRSDNYLDHQWLKDFLNKKGKNIRGEWVPRKLYTSTDYAIDVVSYVYSMNALTSSLKGSVVVNVYAESIKEYLNPTEDNEDRICFLLDENNKILSHPDTAFIGRDMSFEPYVQVIMNSGKNKEYFFSEEDGNEYIYAYSKEVANKWTYVLRYDVNALMANAKHITKNMIIIVILILAIGIIIAFGLSYWVSKPLRNIIDKISGDQELKDLGLKNEWQYISHAFQKMQAQGQELHTILLQKNEDSNRLLLRELLVDAVEEKKDPSELAAIFPYNHFIVIMINIDESTKYLRAFNSDERGYHFMVMEEFLHKVFKGSDYIVEFLRYDAITGAAIINLSLYDEQKVPMIINNALIKLKDHMKNLNGYTITIGVSGVHNEFSSIHNCGYEANLAAKRRIIEGKNSIIFWKPSMNYNKGYYYPYASEKKIINYINVGDYESIQYELKQISKQILEVSHISYENVILIYNQLAGTTIKCLVEKSVNMEKIFGSGTNIYSMITTKDTLQEIEKVLIEFFNYIEEYLADNKIEKQKVTGKKILEYLSKNYKQDLIFEDVAKQMGISYSYMRKLVKDHTGSSPIDYINKLRIEEAKRLLAQTEMSIVSIAEEVGYHNGQSINRFFKKYEGVSPKEFRDMIG